MKYILIAPVGEDMDSMFLGLKEFSVEKVILISTKDKSAKANKAKEDLEKFKMNVSITYLEGNLWEETFRVISEIKKIYPSQELIIK